MSLRRICLFSALAIVLVYAVSEVTPLFWRTSFPEVPTAAEATRAQETDRRAQERDFQRRMAMEWMSSWTGREPSASRS